MTTARCEVLEACVRVALLSSRNSLFGSTVAAAGVALAVDSTGKDGMQGNVIPDPTSKFSCSVSGEAWIGVRVRAARPLAREVGEVVGDACL